VETDRKHVSDVMHRGVVVCESGLPAGTAARMMAAHRIHSVVVVPPAGEPRVVTDVEIAAVSYAGMVETTNAEEIARPAALVRRRDSLAYALERMHECKTTHAVVVERSLRPVGVISVLDLVEAMLERTAA
jgi:CBS domain-containing protein